MASILTPVQPSEDELTLLFFSRYTLIAVVVYYFYGQDVASPALSSASPVVRKIAWTISIPTIIVAGVIAAFILNSDTLLLIWKREQMCRPVQGEQALPVEANEKGSEENRASQELFNAERPDSPTPISLKKEWIARVVISTFTPLRGN